MESRKNKDRTTASGKAAPNPAPRAVITEADMRDLKACLSRSDMRHLAAVCLDISRNRWHEEPDLGVMTPEELESFVFDRVELLTVEDGVNDAHEAAGLRTTFDAQVFLEELHDVLRLHYYRGELDYHGTWSRQRAEWAAKGWGADR